MDEIFTRTGPPFHLQLTAWDRRMPPMYSKRILGFPLQDNSQEHKEQISQLLLKALQATLNEVPFLGGSVVPFSRTQPWLHDISSEGAAHLEVKDLSEKIKFSELRKAKFDPSLLNAEQLCPFPEAVYAQDSPIDVCRLRANFAEDGLLLVICIIHTVCDGRGISEVLKVFANKFREAQNSDHETLSERRVDISGSSCSFDRNLVLSGSGAIGAIEDHQGWTVSPLKLSSGLGITKSRCRNYFFSSSSLQTLKQIASSPPMFSTTAEGRGESCPTITSGISTNDAIAALIWRSIMAARRRAGIISDDETTHFSQAVDCRPRLGLPEPYYGNAIYGIKASLDLSRISAAEKASADSQLSIAAHTIRAEVNAATGDKFRDLLAFVERTEMQQLTRLSVQDELSTRSILFVSYWRFEMHELDFGEALGGNIEFFRLPSSGLLPGMPVVFPRLPDGSCEIMINEREDVMEYLGGDDYFLKFAGQ